MSETRIVKRLTAATALFSDVSHSMERMIYLMAQSRVLELEVISKLGMLPNDVASRLVDDLNRLKSEAERSSIKSLLGDRN